MVNLSLSDQCLGYYTCLTQIVQYVNFQNVLYHFAVNQSIPSLFIIFSWVLRTTNLLFCFLNVCRFDWALELPQNFLRHLITTIVLYFIHIYMCVCKCYIMCKCYIVCLYTNTYRERNICLEIYSHIWLIFLTLICIMIMLAYIMNIIKSVILSQKMYQ